MSPFLVLGAGAGGLAVIVWLAMRVGSKSARLEALRADMKYRAKEHAYVETVLNRVNRMPERTVRLRLRRLGSKK